MITSKRKKKKTKKKPTKKNLKTGSTGNKVMFNEKKVESKPKKIEVCKTCHRTTTCKCDK